jgi:hypothetical protein
VSSNETELNIQSRREITKCVAKSKASKFQLGVVACEAKTSVGSGDEGDSTVSCEALALAIKASNVLQHSAIEYLP